MENIYVGNTILKLFPNGEVWRFGFKCNLSKEKKWHFMKGWSQTIKKIYKSHYTCINNITYITARLLGYAFLRLDLEDKEDTIDHIDRNSLNNHISNLRCASYTLQNLNTIRNIQAKGYCLTPSGKYQARITINYKTINLGLYDTAEEANQVFLVELNKRLNEIN